MSTLKAKIEKSDVINFGAIIALIMYVILVLTHLFFASRSSNPVEAIKDVITWALPVLMGILTTYGIVKTKSLG